MQGKGSGFGYNPCEDEEKGQIAHRSSSDPENVEGAGIGLVITKNLLELMDGNIGVESEPGKGSTFWIELPLSDSGTSNESEKTNETYH